MHLFELLLLVSLAAPAGPLQTARAHLARGELDQVLLSLNGQTFTGADLQTSAQLLAEAGQKGLARGDSLLALQCAQVALRQSKALPLALEVGARAGLAQAQLDLAEGYADRWIAAAPKDARPQLLRAEVAAREGDWDQVLARSTSIRAQALPPAERARLEALRQRAQVARTSEARSPRGLDQRLIEARAQARDAERQADLSAAAPSFAGPSDRAPFVDDDRCWGFCAERAQIPPLESSIPSDPDELSNTHWVNVGEPSPAPVGSGRPPLLPN